MIKTLLVAGTAFGLALAGAASAGPCSTEIDSLQKQLSSSDAGMGPTGTGQIAETNLHPPTETMNQATEGKAASSEDVAAQNQGQPTDADAAQAGASAAPAETDASLERARQFDQAGDEAACMDEVNKVKSQLGAQ
jgi:hypothetical protein